MVGGTFSLPQQAQGTTTNVTCDIGYHSNDTTAHCVLNITSNTASWSLNQPCLIQWCPVDNSDPMESWPSVPYGSRSFGLCKLGYTAPFLLPPFRDCIFNNGTVMFDAPMDQCQSIFIY